MIPTLFPAGTTDFTTNGLGRLSDAISCTVLEERNGAYVLTMTYPTSGIHFSDIAHSRIIFAQPADGKREQPFRISQISKPLNGICEIEAEHISYQMSYIPVEPFTSGSVLGALTGLKDHAAENCPFTFWSDKSGTAPFEVKVPSSLRSLLGGQRGSILDVYGGEYEFDRYTVKLYADRGYDNHVTLRYGKNITDIRQEETIANTVTGVMPYWKGNGSQAGTGQATGELEETIVMLPEKVLHSSNAVNFPYQRTVPLDLSDKFENEPTEDQLRAAAQSYITLNRIGVPAVTVNVSFIPLWETEEYKNIASLERVNLCDTVTVEFEKLGISVKAKVVKTEYDVLKERYKSIEIGEAKTNLVQAISGDMNDKIEQVSVGFEAVLKQEIERATRLLTNPGDSYVVFVGRDKNGTIVYGNGTVPNPQEILVMNTSSPSTATEILRINKNGIGFANNINGPYRSAWTLDGHFNGDVITAGTINGNLIRTGILSDYNGSTFVLTQDRQLKTGKAYYRRAAVPGYNASMAYAVGDLARYNGTVYKCRTAITAAEPWTSGHWTAAGSQDYLYVLVDTPMPNEMGGYYELQNNHRNYWNLETGEFSLSAAATVGGETIASQQDLGDLSDDLHNDMEELENSINSDMISMEERLTPEELTQQRVFNALTNNGQTMGIWLKASDDKLYINASYIATGVLADANNNTIFSLETGKLTMNKGSINIANRFKVTESGYLTCSGADIQGSFKAGTDYKWIELGDDGRMAGYKYDSDLGRNVYCGYIDFSATVNDYSTSPASVLRGIQIQGDILRINTYRISAAQSTDTSDWTYHGGNGTLSVVYDVFYDANGVVQGRIANYRVINGLICSEFSW